MPLPKKNIRKSSKNIVTIGTVMTLTVLSSALLIEIPSIKQLLTDVTYDMSVEASVPVNMLDSTPETPQASSNCRTITWSNILPFNDSENPFTDGEYKVEVALSPTFNTLEESSSYAAGLTYQVQNALQESTAYYFRTQARDPLRPDEESHYSDILQCTTSTAQESTPPSGSSGGGGGGMGTTTLPPGDSSDAPAWIEQTFIRPMIGKAPIDLTVTTTTQKQKGIPLDAMKKTGLKPVYKDRLTIIKRTNQTQSPNTDPTSKDELPIKATSIKLKGPKSILNPENIVAAYFDEASQTWKKIPTYYNTIDQTYRFRAISTGVYALATVENIQSKFQDINRHEWFYEYAENSRLLGVAPQDTEESHAFDPHKPITQEEAQEILGRAFGTSGNKNTNLAPFNTLTRGDAVGFIMQSARFSAKTIEGGVRTTSFNDVSKTNANYEFILKAYQFNIIRGYNDNTFRPEAGISRAEFTKILIKSMENRYLLDALQYSPNLQSVIEKELSIHSKEYVGTKTISAKDILNKLVTLSKK